MRLEMRNAACKVASASALTFSRSFRPTLLDSAPARFLLLSHMPRPSCNLSNANLAYQGACKINTLHWDSFSLLFNPTSQPVSLLSLCWLPAARRPPSTSFPLIFASQLSALAALLPISLTLHRMPDCAFNTFWQPILRDSKDEARWRSCLRFG